MQKRVAKVLESSVKINVPVERFPAGYPKNDIDAALEYFRQIIITSQHFKFRQEESDYDHCHMLLKWALTCNAKLKNIEPAIIGYKPSLQFTFTFEGIEMLDHFIKYFDNNVNGI